MGARLPREAKMTVQVLLVGAVVAVLAAAAFCYLKPKSRGSQLATLSSGLGLSPEPDESVLKASGLLETPLLKRERFRCRNILRGDVRGAEAVFFEYSVNDGRGWRPPDPVACFRPREKRLPPFYLCPRASSESPRGLEIEAAPRFNEIYTLSGEDDGTVRELFLKELVEFFERSENQAWTVSSKGDWIAVAFWPLGERRHALSAKETLGFLEDAKELLFVLTAAPLDSETV
jgi:hypothetical protein